jgi:hypothetical protein
MALRTRSRMDFTVQKERCSTLPQVIVRTGIDGREESLTEYLCDWSGCPNVAVEVLGGVRELNMSAAVCAEHALLLANSGNRDSGR